MAQYKSYRSAISSENAEPAISGQNKNPGAGFRRSALAVLNGNRHSFLAKDSIWKADRPCGEEAPSQASFPIFEDEMHIATPEIKDAPAPENLPTCVTKLYDMEGMQVQDFDSMDIAKENVMCFADTPIRDKKRERMRLEQKWTAPFRDDIHEYLKNLETKFRPSASYMRKQPDITMNMRSVLVDWLIEVGEEYKLQEETLHLAVAYADRFLSRLSVLRGKLQLVGTTCMFIAAKHEEIYPPELKDFEYITDNTYSKRQILRMEQLVLNVLNFDLAIPTAYSFLQLYANMSCASEQVLFLAQYICEISMLEAEPFLAFLPSQIGASCLALANHVLGDWPWPSELVEVSGYNLEDILIIVQCLFEKYSTISSYPQQAVCEKYRSSKFLCVADMKCPEKLSF